MRKISPGHSLALFITFLMVISCGRKVVSSPEEYGQAPVQATSGEPQVPRLIVMLSVDQMQASYLDRYAELYTGGLKRLREQGLVFENANHEHALTLTAPGHASLSTGCYPSRHGIIGNDFFDRATMETVYAVTDSKAKIVGIDNDVPSHSPVNLKVPAIGDWLKKDHRQSKVYAVALKDRSSILMGGQKPDQAFWFDEVSTRFISSTHYGKNFPEWAEKIVGLELFKADIEKGWHKKLNDNDVYERLAGPDEVIFENARFLPTFPHTSERMAGFVRPEIRTREMLWTAPFGDQFTLYFARELVEHYQLGADDVPDMLMVSCSAADAIGHHFGPDSQEVMDYYLWLDSYLEAFLNFLDQKVGRNRYLLVLSADHGVVSMPEVAAQKGIDAKRVTTSDFTKIMKEFDRNHQKDLGLTTSIIHTANFNGVSLNYEEARGKGISEAQLRKTIAEDLKKLYFVSDAYFMEELDSSGPGRPYLELYRRSTYPGRGHDINLRYKENYLVYYGPTGTTHGSPYSYDSQVPLVFYGFGMPGKRIERKVATVDIAPTLARILRLRVQPGQFDGSLLPEATLYLDDH